MKPSIRGLCHLLTEKKELKVLGEAEEWLDLARPHNLEVLVSRALIRHGHSNEDDPVIEKTLRDARLRWFLLKKIFDAAKEILDRSRIRFVPVKGIDLAQRIYDNPTDRGMTDVDFLLDEKGFFHAVDLLSHEEFKINHSEKRRAELQIKEEGAPILELVATKHRTLDNAEVNQLGYFSLPKIEYAAYLIQHCAHKHRCESLHWLYDLHLILREFNIYEWERLRQHCDQLGMQNQWFLVLTLLRDAFSTTRPRIEATHPSLRFLAKQDIETWLEPSSPVLDTAMRRLVLSKGPIEVLQRSLRFTQAPLKGK